MNTFTRSDRPCPGPDPSPRSPTRFVVPLGAVDTHAHIVGDSFVAERSFTPPSASADAYLRMLDAVGMTYGVLVQVSVHGTDNSRLLETLTAHRDRLRGVAVAAPDCSDATLDGMRAAGVVGLRINTMTGGGIGFEHLDRYEAICTEMGWHLQFFIGLRDLEAAASQLRKLRVPYVIDHMGYFNAADGLTSRGWKLMLGLMAEGAWTKLSGAFRLAGKRPYMDTVPFARSLIEVAPERCVWGSDWPQVGFWGPMPNIGDLLDLLADWAPESGTRDKILITNARRLYGFPAPR